MLENERTPLLPNSKISKGKRPIRMDSELYTAKIMKKHGVVLNNSTLNFENNQSLADLSNEMSH